MLSPKRNYVMSGVVLVPQRFGVCVPVYVCSAVLFSFDRRSLQFFFLCNIMFIKFSCSSVVVRTPLVRLISCGGCEACECARVERVYHNSEKWVVHVVGWHSPRCDIPCLLHLSLLLAVISPGKYEEKEGFGLEYSLPVGR